MPQHTESFEVFTTGSFLLQHNSFQNIQVKYFIIINSEYKNLTNVELNGTDPQHLSFPLIISVG